MLSILILFTAHAITIGNIEIKTHILRYMRNSVLPSPERVLLNGRSDKFGAPAMSGQTIQVQA